METPPDPGNGHGGSAVWPVVALGLLGTGWAAFFLTLGYAARLADGWGPAPEVFDALARDADIARHALPCYSALLFLDVLAVGSLAAPSRPGWPRALKVLVAVLLVPTVLLHGWAWMVTCLFAG
jgi:hypothetical protein